MKNEDQTLLWQLVYQAEFILRAAPWHDPTSDDVADMWKRSFNFRRSSMDSWHLADEDL